ncbi:flavodoxin [Heyndrickxia ginsengihumi]|uniref:flavodoxin n=1 Tax=Heyndrickxia ginsengihumi TaxID=363870 RepID=UPI002041B0AE|nr:flavodoxin [Heyndrickxia ginsengihumi]MCM3023643.1 NAD(P)H-dependent oxidoreductase [Heyndrickxia ginsengihumi]
MIKKNAIFLLITVICVIIVGFIILSKTTNQNEKEGATMKNSKTLIVYYSRTGNTKAVAELIQEKVGGDLVQIETKEPRPKDYRTEVEQNAQEQESATLPELKTTITNFEDYDRIFIGAPTWNMALPQAVVSFLDSYNFEGKTVIPFNTNGGYGPGSTFRQIKAGAKGAKVLEGYSVKGGEEINGTMLAIKGKNKAEVSKEIDTWLEKIKQLKK